MSCAATYPSMHRSAAITAPPGGLRNIISLPALEKEKNSNDRDTEYIMYTAACKKKWDENEDTGFYGRK